jgi:hypothetical protein
MNFASSAHLLSLWDQAQGEKPGRQGLILLMRLADLTPEKAGEYRVGERDAFLLRIRKQLFGSQAEAAATCPACGDVSEFSFDVDALMVTPQETMAEEYTFGPYQFALRCPTALDASLVCSAPGLGAAEEFLLGKCLRYVRHGDDYVSPDQYRLLPRDVRGFISATLERCDPQAAAVFEIQCRVCGTNWTELFDVVSFLWAEIADTAARALREVHELATSYGWAESEIVNMHPARRRFYLSMGNA